MSEKLPVTSPSLDARTLLSRSMDDFHAKEYRVEGDFQVLWGIIDIYLDRLEPVMGSATDEGHLEKHSPKYRENRKKLYRSIMVIPGFDIDQIETVRIDSNGMLSMKQKNGTIQIKNLIESWNSFFLIKPNITPIISGTKVQKTELKEAINTESYLGGSILVQYAPYIPGTIAVGAMGHAGYSFVRDTLSLGKDAKEFIVKSIFIRDGTGKIRIVSLAGVYKGSKKAIGENLFRILEKAGYIFEASTRSFFNPAERAFSETGWKIQTLKYTDWKKQNPDSSLTETEFQKIRSEILEKMKGFSQSIEGKIDTTFLEKVGLFSKSLGRNAGELFFLPVFFREFRKHQDTATFLMGASEIALFTGGSRLATALQTTRIGARLPIPGLGRPIVTLLAGGAAIVGGAELMKALDGNRNKWRHLYENKFGSLYTDGKSTIGHFVSGIGITEGLDLLNKAGRKVAPNEDDWDIGIPRTEIPLWNGKYLGTLPDITFFQAKINFGTAPQDWIRGADGRTTDDWNKYVEYYQVRLKKEIFNLIDKYRKNESMFSDSKKVKEAGGKENLLKKHLEDILVGSEGGNTFLTEKQSLINGILAEAKRTPFEPSISEGIIDNRVSQMKIDNLFIDNRILELQEKKKKIVTSISFLGPYISEKTLKYMDSISQRMLENQSIVSNDGGKWEQYKAPLTGEILKKWIPSVENNYFQGLLDDNRMVQIDTGNGEISIKLGEYFAWILDQMLEYKRESEFIREIKSGNKKGIKWGI